MRNLTSVFGDKPRVRLLEALLSLAPHEFTRGELAGDAGLARRSANRVFPELLDLGVVTQVSDGSQPRYVARGNGQVFQILQYLDHALELGLQADEANDAASEVSELFRLRLADIIGAEATHDAERRLISKTVQFEEYTQDVHESVASNEMVTLK